MENPNQIEEFIVVLMALRKIKQHISSAPTLIPKHFLDQIQFYENGSTRRVYFYINNTWRYVAVT